MHLVYFNADVSNSALQNSGSVSPHGRCDGGGGGSKDDGGGGLGGSEGGGCGGGGSRYRYRSEGVDGGGDTLQTVASRFLR